MIKIAVTQYQIDLPSTWSDFEIKMTNFVEKAKGAGADLLLLPEYTSLEFAGSDASDVNLFATIHKHLSQYLKLFQDLAVRYQLYIQAGTTMVRADASQYYNRAYLFARDGSYGFQDKLHLTAAEKESGIIAKGQQLSVFDTHIGKIGIAICYDSEFPEVVTQLVSAGAWIVLVPSLTTSVAGYNRVYLSSRARAIENQCYLATSCLVGPLTLDKNGEHGVGHAAILSPVDTGFPDNGILAAGNFNEVTMIVGELHQEQLIQTRKIGQVQNYIDRFMKPQPSDYPVINLKLQ